MSENMKHIAFISELSNLLARYPGITISGNGDDRSVFIYDDNTETTIFNNVDLDGYMKTINKHSTGVVNVDGRRRDVTYHFVSEDTIHCVDNNGTSFYTHYKSLET